MGKILTELIAAGMVTKLDGDDDRLGKMDRAAATLVKELRKSRKLLVPAILAALNPKANIRDAMMLKAEAALKDEWPTMASIHTDPPLSLYRALLLDACNQVAEGSNAAVIWYTAVDTLRYSALDREEDTVRKMLAEIASRAEQASRADETNGKARVAPPAPEREPDEQEDAGFALPLVERSRLEGKILAALGPHGVNNVQHTNANRYFPQNNQHWVSEAAPRLVSAIAEEIDRVSNATSERLAEYQNTHDERLASIEESAQAAVTAARNVPTSERQRLDALWWLETLYSPSQHCSYRELDNELAAIVMAFDLLSLVPGIMPPSLPYLLAEGVDRLPGASYRDKKPLEAILTKLTGQRSHLPAGLTKGAAQPQQNVRLSLRDVVVSALGDSTPDINRLLNSAEIDPVTEMSLPEFARAVLRQEHAVRLASLAK